MWCVQCERRGGSLCSSLCTCGPVCTCPSREVGTGFDHPTLPLWCMAPSGLRLAGGSRLAAFPKGDATTLPRRGLLAGTWLGSVSVGARPRCTCASCCSHEGCRALGGPMLHQACRTVLPIMAWFLASVWVVCYARALSHSIR